MADDEPFRAKPSGGSSRAVEQPQRPKRTGRRAATIPEDEVAKPVDDVVQESAEDDADDNDDVSVDSGRRAAVDVADSIW